MASILKLMSDIIAIVFLTFTIIIIDKKIKAKIKMLKDI